MTTGSIFGTSLVRDTHEKSACVQVIVKWPDLGMSTSSVCSCEGVDNEIIVGKTQGSESLTSKLSQTSDGRFHLVSFSTTQPSIT